MKRTLQEIMRCAIEGVEFDGKIVNINNTGRKVIILPGSVDEVLITNWAEAHCGFQMTTVMINEHIRQERDAEVSVYAVKLDFVAFNQKLMY